MRKKRSAILLTFVYVVLLISLLVLQSFSIEGKLPKFAANVIAVVLVIPGGFLLKGYIRLKEQEKQEKEQLLKEKGEKSPEQLRKDFYEQMEQCSLSVREQEVAWLIYRGYRNLQIAEELYISEATVKKHVSHIYEKTKVSGRKEFREKFCKNNGKRVTERD